MKTAFRQWRVRSVLDVAYLSPAAILRIRWVGRKKFEALKGAIETAISPEDPATSPPEHRPTQNAQSRYSPLLRRTLSKQEVAILEGVSVDAVIQDVRARNAFRELGMTTALAAIRVTPERLMSVRNAGRKTVSKSAAEIESAVASLGTQPESVPLTAKDVERYVTKHLLSQVSDRERRVLIERHGLWDGQRETLEDIGGEFGVTRERIRQLQVKGERKLKLKRVARQRAKQLMDQFREAAHAALRGKREGISTSEELLNAVYGLDGHSLALDVTYDFLKEIFWPDENPLAEGLVSLGNHGIAVDNETRQRYERALAAAKIALVSKGRPRPSEELAKAICPSVREDVSPSFLRSCAEASDEIGVDEAGNIGLRRWHHFNPKTIEQMAYNALMELGEPAHYTHIASRMNVLFPRRAPFSDRSVHNALIHRSDQFVCLRRGMFALANWGIRPAPFIRDFLIAELQGAEGPLHQDELVRRGTSKHGYRETSVRMTLNLNAKIFKTYPGNLFSLQIA